MQQQAKGDLGQWLKERCEKEGLSLRQMAAKTGLSHGTIGDVIKGVQPSAQTICKLAKAFSRDGTHQRLALEDKLLVLAGYRTQRSDEEEVSEPAARLIDSLSKFNELQLKIMARFADFLSETEEK